VLQRPRAEIFQALEFSYPASIPSVLNVLDKGGVQAQTQVLEILKNWHDDDPRILAAIQNTFTNVEPMIRQRGSYALGAIAAQSPSGIESIRRGLRDPDTLVRRFNAFSAGLARTNAVTLVPELIAAKTDADRITARFAATALRMLRSRDADRQEPN
jgi:HEAT repeat protein